MGILTLLSQFWGKPPQFAYRVTVTAGQSTTPKFTFAAGAPAAVVDWGDGTARSAVTSAVELNHAYTPAGTFTVRLIAPNQQTYLTGIEIENDLVSYINTSIQLFPKLTLFRARTNPAWIQNISGWVLPPAIINVQIYSSGATGNIGSWILPSTLQYCYLYSTSLSGNVSNWILPTGLLEYRVQSTSITGDIGSLILPSGLTYFYIFSTSMTGCPILSSMVAIRELYIQNCALPQSTVDLYLSRCVAVEAQTTYATPILNLGGTNAAPSAQGVTDHLTLEAAGWVVTITA